MFQNILETLIFAASFPGSCVVPLESTVAVSCSSSNAQLKQIGTDDGVCLSGSLVRTICGLETQNHDGADGWQRWKKDSTEETPAVTVTGAECVQGHAETLKIVLERL